MNKLFTVLINFSDHLKGMGQYEAETPLEALKKFIELSESLEGYNRSLMTDSIMPLVHYKNEKGLWGFYFKPLVNLSVSNDNPVLGGNIVQTDPDVSRKVT